METRTNELQWVTRTLPDRPYPGTFLQQKWIITDEAGNTTEEWRDVPYILPPELQPNQGN